MTGNDYICGKFSVGKGKSLYIDTRTGEGTRDLFKIFEKFAIYQANKVNFPYSTVEDTKQDIMLLAVEALPKYNPDKNTNVITFLQGHVKKRLINKFKYVTVKKRMATYNNNSLYKARCPKCFKMAKFEQKERRECGQCKYNGDDIWKTYNISVSELPMTSFATAGHKGRSSDSEGDKDRDIIDSISQKCNLSCFLSVTDYDVETTLQKKIDFIRVMEKLSNEDRLIITMMIKGFTGKEIATKVNLPEKDVYAGIVKIKKRIKWIKRQET